MRSREHLNAGRRNASYRGDARSRLLPSSGSMQQLEVQPTLCQPVVVGLDLCHLPRQACSKGLASCLCPRRRCIRCRCGRKGGCMTAHRGRKVDHQGTHADTPLAAGAVSKGPPGHSRTPPRFMAASSLSSEAMRAASCAASRFSMPCNKAVPAPRRGAVRRWLRQGTAAATCCTPCACSAVEQSRVAHTGPLLSRLPRSGFPPTLTCTTSHSLPLLLPDVDMSGTSTCW